MLKPFTPNLLVASVHKISQADLSARGIKGILFDLDNTLLTHYGTEFDPDLVAWMRRAQDAGFGLCIASNGYETRTLGLAEKLGIPAVARSQKPRRSGLRRGLAVLGLQPSEAAMVGDQIFTDIWAGNRLGMYTILVDPIDSHEPWPIRAKRRLEWVVLRSMGARTRGSQIPPELNRSDHAEDA
jgi:uncharacterized protein